MPFGGRWWRGDAWPACARPGGINGQQQVRHLYGEISASLSKHRPRLVRFRTIKSFVGRSSIEEGIFSAGLSPVTSAAIRIRVTEIQAALTVINF